MKIAYIGIDLFAPALEILLSEGCELLELFTCRTDNLTEFNSKVISIAQNAGVPYKLDRITIADFVRLKEKGCEAVFCAGYYYKIPVFPDIPTLNIHPSLLPKGRGGWPMPIAILRRERESGVTIHKIAEGFDTGDIVVQRSFVIEEKENLETFMQKVYALLPEMLSYLIENFDKAYKNAVPQSGAAEYLEMPDKSMYTIYPDTEYEKAELVLRAFYGYDCYYNDGNNEYMLIRAKALKKADIKTENSHTDEKCAFFSIKDGYVACEKTNVKVCKDR